MNEDTTEDKQPKLRDKLRSLSGRGPLPDLTHNFSEGKLQQEAEVYLSKIKEDMEKAATRRQIHMVVAVESCLVASIAKALEEEGLTVLAQHYPHGAADLLISWL